MTNAPKQIVPAAIPNIASANPSQTSNVPSSPKASNIRIVTINPTNKIQSAVSDSNVDIGKIAPAFEPSVSSIIDIFDGAGCRVVGYFARKSLDDAQVKKIIGDISIPDKTKKALVPPASRIAARRIKNPEVADWICVIGAITDWGTNIAIVITELREMNKQNQLKGK